MSERDERIARQYQVENLAERILSRLEEAGRDLEALTPRDLAPVDEFHMRGPSATAELATLGGLERGHRVLDIGCGLGGSARFLASQHGCEVTGVDVTASYCSAARELSLRLGLADRTQFRRASALSLPFEAGAFDAVWTEHMHMNVEDKPALCAEVFRVLRPGGRYLFHEVMAGEGGAPRFPVPWADDASLSFLSGASEARDLLKGAGFAVREWLDVSARARAFVVAGRSRPRPPVPPPISLHLLLGADATEKFRNMVRNLEEERIALVMAVLEKPGA